MPYTQEIGSKNPGAIIILIDQSSSMLDIYSIDQTKAFAASRAVNKVINEIIERSQAGNEIKDRAYITVIGYGAKVQELSHGKVSKLASEPTFIKVSKTIPDGDGGTIDVEIDSPQWIQAIAEGSTPMIDAFNKASIYAKEFIKGNPNSFPPIVINITDGVPNEFQLEQSFENNITAAENLKSLSTSDGNVLLLNAHISEKAQGHIDLPSSADGFQNDAFACFLFGISSELPEPMLSQAEKMQFNVSTGAKGFVYNADAVKLTQILDIGSKGPGLR